MNGTQANCNGNIPYRTERKGPFLNTTAAVRSYVRASPHPWGLVDMLGNLWEWCRDWFADVSEGEATDPVGPESGEFRVVRGGGWLWDAKYCRAACRLWDAPDKRGNYLGFRLAAGPSGE